MPEGVPARVLLIQLKRAGDVVVSTALLEDIHRAHPSAECDWMVGWGAAEVLERHPLVARTLVFDPRDLVGMSRAARRGRYDWVIDVQGSWRTAIATARSRAAARVGWSGWNRGWAYSHRVQRAPRDSRVYVVQDRRRLLAAIHVPATDAVPSLHLTEHERNRGERRVQAAAGGARAVVGMVISTSDPVKDWPPERFAAVATALRAEGVASVVFPTPGAQQQEDAFRAAAGDAAHFGPLVRLRELMELIAACDVFVSGDTGPAHIATALGIPRVTVYGPSQAQGWTPPGSNAVAVRDVAARCEACAGRAPRDAHSCLETVTPQMVLGAIRAMLAARTGRTE
jgi:lipopolysaccharide heptosyltransferase II